MKAIVYLLMTSLVFAKPAPKAKEKSKAAREPASYKYVVSNEEWMTMMSRDLPSAFCDSREYYGFCFDTDRDTCSLTVQKIASRCYRRISIPRSVRLSTHGIDLGQWLGRCVGGEYEKQMSAKRKNNAVCKESRQWF